MEHAGVTFSFVCSSFT